MDAALTTRALFGGGFAVVRAASATFLALVALAVGWSRVFLLDHYASDVVGSVMIGVAWVAVVVHTASS